MSDEGKRQREAHVATYDVRLRDRLVKAIELGHFAAYNPWQVIKSAQEDERTCDCPLSYEPMPGPHTEKEHRISSCRGVGRMDPCGGCYDCIIAQIRHAARLDPKEQGPMSDLFTPEELRKNAIEQLLREHTAYDLAEMIVVEREEHADQLSINVGVITGNGVQAKLRRELIDRSITRIDAARTAAQTAVEILERTGQGLRLASDAVNATLQEHVDNMVGVSTDSSPQFADARTGQPVGDDVGWDTVTDPLTEDQVAEAVAAEHAANERERAAGLRDFPENMPPGID